ncbi:MAG TPA: hypothetical protein VID67_07530 [Rhizomicrobium sp.]
MKYQKTSTNEGAGQDDSEGYPVLASQAQGRATPVLERCDLAGRKK